MSCEICGRNSCTRSFHSLKDQEDFDNGGPEVRLERELTALRAENERMREDAERMKAATYSHVDGRDLLHELQPNGAHHIDIVVRINGQDRRYEGDWLKNLTYARDSHNMGEYADNQKLRAMIEAARAEATSAQVPTIGMGIDAARKEGK